MPEMTTTRCNAIILDILLASSLQAAPSTVVNILLASSLQAAPSSVVDMRLNILYANECCCSGCWDCCHSWCHCVVSRSERSFCQFTLSLELSSSASLLPRRWWELLRNWFGRCTL